MFRILVSDPIAEAGIEKLRAVGEVDVRTGLSPEDLLAAIGEYDALAVRSETKVTAQVIAAAAKLRIIGRAGVGVDNIDVRAATERGIVVVNSPRGNTIAAAELSIAMLLALARNIPQADASLRAGKWERKRFVGTEVYDKTLGVVGLGKIGGEVARRARGLEMRVLAYDPFATEESVQQIGAKQATLDEIYEESDFITLHVPMNEQTRGMIGAEQIGKMKDGVRIINCARGGLVDEQALAVAIESGKVGGVAFDVFLTEPVDPANPLLAQAQNVVTPHLGASTEEAQVHVSIDIAEQIADVLNGLPARAAVNMPPVSAEALERARPYLLLAERMGSLQTQLARELDGRGRPIESVEVLYQGDFSEIPTNAVTRAALAGLLTPILSEPVNLVNAPSLAASRGLKVTESIRSSAGEYSHMVTLTIATPAGTRTICGTVFGKNDVRIVHVDHYRVDIAPDGPMLMAQHTDRPGMIGAVGTLLGAAGINVAGMNVGRDKVGGRALMVLMVDTPVPDELLVALRALPGMETARQVNL